jgi:methionyl-tRNA synthetase
MDIRVGTILEAEKYKQKQIVSIENWHRNDVRTIVSGIAESFKPEDIVVKRNF